MSIQDHFGNITFVSSNQDSTMSQQLSDEELPIMETIYSISSFSVTWQWSVEGKIKTERTLIPEYMYWDFGIVIPARKLLPKNVTVVGHVNNYAIYVVTILFVVAILVTVGAFVSL